MERTLQDRARRLTDLGFARFQEERFADAESCFRTAAVANPEDEDAWIGLGASLMKQERAADAAIVFGTAAAIARSNGVWPTLLAAEALLQAGELERAAQAMAWFDHLEATAELGEPERDLGRTLRARIEEETR